MREILAVEPIFDESEDSWREFFRKLKRRGLRRVCLCVSDAHAGIQAAVKKELLGAFWQRCKVHFMRNILSKVPHKEKRRFAAHLKQIWLQPDRKSARRAADQLAQENAERFPEAIRCPEEGLEDSLQFYGFPEIDPKKISSTNTPERTTREVRWRSRVVGVFPSVDSWVRLELVTYNGVLGGLAHRPNLYQTGEDPGSYGEKPWLPRSSGSKLKRVMIAGKWRTQFDMALARLRDKSVSVNTIRLIFMIVFKHRKERILFIGKTYLYPNFSRIGKNRLFRKSIVSACNFSL